MAGTSILLTMTSAATPVPLPEAKARLVELARRARQHERIILIVRAAAGNQGAS